jgi:AcrR family transcriptional regulator
LKNLFESEPAYMPIAANVLPAADTRGRLLDAATVEFAERGFGGARIREIVARAGTNLAAINYHFGGKEPLYAAVLEHHAHRAITAHPTHLAAGFAELPPERRLELFIRGLLMRVLDDDPGAMFARLIAREILDPTPALDHLANAFVRPQAQALCEIIAEITGERPASAAVCRCTMSIVGQCMSLHFLRHVLRRVFPEVPFTLDAVDALVRHILAFSLDGLRVAALAGEPRPRPRVAGAPRARRRA